MDRLGFVGDHFVPCSKRWYTKSAKKELLCDDLNKRCLTDIPWIGIG